MKLPVLAVVAAFSFPIPVIAGIVRFKRLSTAMRVFLLFCIFALAEIVGEYVLGRKNINNTFLSNYSFLIETAFIVTVYLLSVESKKVKQIIVVSALLFLCIWIIDKIYFEIANRLNDEMAIASRVCIILITVVTIHSIAKQMNHPFTGEPIFWASSGIVIYSSGVILVVGLSNELLKMGTSYFLAAWHINWAMAIISNLMYTKGFFCTSKYQISSGS
jgi:hypothetical protein